MGKQIKVSNPNNLPTIPHSKLVDFQKDFKTISIKSLEKLCRSVVKYGFIFPKFVWLSKGLYYIIDGHQTIQALKHLETVGIRVGGVITQYEIPEIPYILVEAKTKKQAAERVAILNATYGKLNKETDFFTRFDIGAELFDIADYGDFDFDCFALDQNTSLDSKPEDFTDDNCELPIVPDFFEHHECFVIATHNEIDETFVRDLFKVDKNHTSNSGDKKIRKTNVISMETIRNIADGQNS